MNILRGNGNTFYPDDKLKDVNDFNYYSGNGATYEDQVKFHHALTAQLNSNHNVASRLYNELLIIYPNNHAIQYNLSRM